MLISAKRSQEYKRISNGNEDLNGDEELRSHPSKTLNRKITTAQIIYYAISLVTAFTIGILVTIYIINPTRMRHDEFETPENMHIAPRITLPQIAGEFMYPSPFSKEAPREGNISEPAWDALIPNGLGYFTPSAASNSKPNASSVVIPSVFHQLHCLYLLRRAYYTDAPDSDLQRFDLGRNRSVHVAHCFDYLAQAITCSADSTLEPAVDKEHGFLGAGFARQCWDFEYLKTFVESKRVFNASGFLAWGAGEQGKVDLG